MTAAQYLCPICHDDAVNQLDKLHAQARANGWFVTRLSTGTVFAVKGCDELEIAFDHDAGQIAATLTTANSTSNPATVSDWITGQQQWEDLSGNEVYGL